MDDFFLLQKLKVLDTKMAYFNIDNEDYISLIDIIKAK